MYEYVQTTTGWRLCWGGAALYPDLAEGRMGLVPCGDDREAEDEQGAAEELMTAPAA